MPRLKLFLNHVVVVPVDPPVTDCAPGEHCHATQRGVVLCVGPGKNPTAATVFKPGDVVWYDHGTGHSAKIGKNDVIVIDDGDVFALESDLDHENQIKTTTREIVYQSGVSADGCFECCDSVWEEGAKQAEAAEAERNPPPPEPVSEVPEEEPEEEGEGSEDHPKKRSHRKK